MRARWSVVPFSRPIELIITLATMVLELVVGYWSGSLALVLVVGCAGSAQVAEVQGDCGMAYKGNVCTWARTRGDSVLEAGATIPMASIEGRPMTPSMDWPPVAEAKAAQRASVTIAPPSIAPPSTAPHSTPGFPDLLESNPEVLIL